MQANKRIDFKAINELACSRLPELVQRWLPDGRRVGSEWVALNPTREDRRLGSFKVNLRSGRWADFATGDTGGDVISLVAYLERIRQVEAAERLAVLLGGGHV